MPLILQKKGLVHDDRHTTFLAYTGIMVDTYIRHIVQNSVKAILSPKAAPLSMDSPAIQTISNIYKMNSFFDLSEYLPHHLGFRFYNRIPTIRALTITQRYRAVVYLTLHSVILHSPLDILGKIC